jgi:glycosyltransferase involved in cell wall biosynthesis
MHRTVFAVWRQDVGDVLRTVDVFALPSHNEGMGKALMEAMYLERPVVATKVRGIPELITDGVEGLLVPPRDPASLMTALQRLASEAGLRQSLGRKEAIKALTYGSDAMVERISNLYEELAAAALEPRRGSAVASQPS